mgnify:CR=1 FL=1
MIEVVYSALLGLLGACTGQFALYLYRRFRNKSNKNTQEIIYKTGNEKSISIPDARDLGSFEERLAAFEQVSPRLAVIDGWNVIHSTLINRAVELNAFSKDKDLSLKALGSNIKKLEELARLSEDLKRQVEEVRTYRNLIVHDSATLPDAAVKLVADSVIPLIKKIGLQYFSGVSPKEKLEP